MQNAAQTIKEYLGQGKTGLLSMKLSGEQFLLKVYLRGGNLTSIALGAAVNQGFLQKHDGLGLTVLQHSFLPDIPDPHPAADMGGITHIIEQYVNAGTQRPDRAAAPTVNNRASSAAHVEYGKVQETERHVIDCIGPIGAIIVSNILSELGVKRGSSLPAALYEQFYEAVVGKLPEDKRAAFRSAFSR